MTPKKTKSADKHSRSDAEKTRRGVPASRGVASPQPANGLLGYQQAAGNQAIQRLMRFGALQAKLTVNQPGDRYEQEADRVAEQVMRMSDREVLEISSGADTIQEKCTACASGGQTCSKCAQEETIQPKRENRQTPRHTSGLASQIGAMRGKGQPLAPSVRGFFEPRFGQDFSNVRVHHNAQAMQTARQINARAYTIGKDIVFGAGEYAPDSAEGQRLLAHELAHVTQQRSDAVPRIQRQPSKKEVDWRPGMRVKLVKPLRYVGTWGYTPPFEVGEILEIISGPHHFHSKPPTVIAVKARLPGRKREGDLRKYSVEVSRIEPITTPQLLARQDQVQFRVDVLSEAAFAKATGIDPAGLPEGTMIPLDQARASVQSPEDPWLSGAAPGVGLGLTRAPWPTFPMPPYTTGVQWTQTGFGHFSQFSNVPGKPVIGGYRSWAPIHAYQGLHSQITGQSWTKPVPGRYFNDWWFRLLSPQSQTLVYRQGTPQHAELVARLIKQGRYTEPYTFPPSAPGTKCTNCITVPKSPMYGALGGEPVIVSEAGVYDITEFGRPSPHEPLTVEQAGRGKTMREWLTRPTVRTPTGEIETLKTARVPPSTVWGARGVTCIRAGGFVLLIYGVYKSRERLVEAAGTPYFHRVVGQEAGSWVGGILGFALGAAGAGAVVCSPTGPVTFVCAAAGFAGGLVVGAAGSMLGAIEGDTIAQLPEVVKTMGEIYSPMLERSIWGDKPIPEMGYYPPRQYGESSFEYEHERERYMRSQGER